MRTDLRSADVLALLMTRGTPKSAQRASEEAAELVFAELGDSLGTRKMSNFGQISV